MAHRLAMNKAQGSNFGKALLAAESVADLRGLTPMPKDAQEQIDDAVVRVGRQRLRIADEILNRGLVYNLPNPLSVMELYWEKLSDVGHAQRTMLPDSRGENQLPDRNGVRIPIYATWDDFALNVRTLRASERAGAPLDVTMVEQATRRVNEAIEDACINGAGLTVDGNTAPGFLNAPNVNTQAYVDNEAWTAAGHSGEDILTDVLNMAGVLEGDNKFGPYTLFVPTTYGNELNKDFKSNSDKTTRGRLEELTFGGDGLKIVVADQLPANRTIMAQMTSDVVDMIVGQQPIPVSWSDGGNWNFNFVVMAFMIPRVKDDYDGQSGIVTGNLT